MARAAAPETDADIPHPRAAHLLFGHNDAERTMLNAYRGGRFPHAWLIGGAPGIGKATLGFRLARFVLAHPNEASPEVQAAAALNVPADHGVARRIEALAHPDLLILQRTMNESGKLRSVIQVDEVRRIVSFFGSTAGEGGWRVCIVDCVEDLNPAGSNALLKMLEEPPARALFILISHAPGRVLPTIRSRCRRLILRPLSSPDVLAALQAITGRDDPELATAAAAAGEGSIGRALALLDPDALALRERLSALLEKLPDLDLAALHRLGDQLGRADEEAFETFVDRVQEWLSAQVAVPAQDLARLNEIAQIWDKIATATRDVEIYNLERKPLVFNVFGLLAEAARR